MNIAHTDLTMMTYFQYVVQFKANHSQEDPRPGGDPVTSSVPPTSQPFNSLPPHLHSLSFICSGCSKGGSLHTANTTDSKRKKQNIGLVTYQHRSDRKATRLHCLGCKSAKKPRIPCRIPGSHLQQKSEPQCFWFGQKTFSPLQRLSPRRVESE